MSDPHASFESLEAPASLEKFFTMKTYRAMSLLGERRIEMILREMRRAWFDSARRCYACANGLTQDG